jgi:hypothetical protein
MTKKEAGEKGGETRLERLRRDASEQVKMYRRAMIFKNKRVRGYVMIFAGPKCVCCELVPE